MNRSARGRNFGRIRPFAAVAAGRIEKNPDVCCETREECTQLGVDDFRTCTGG